MVDLREYIIADVLTDGRGAFAEESDSIRCPSAGLGTLDASSAAIRVI